MSVLFNNAQAYESNPWTGPTTAIGSFTLAVRVFTGDITTSGQTAIEMDGSGGNNQLIILDTGTTPPAWNGFLVNDAHSAFPGVTGPSNVTINTWYHLVLTYDGTTTTLYVDGVSVGTNTPGAITRTGNWSYFGAPVNWIGSAQDICGYSVALSAAQVKQLYLARRPRARTGLLVHWPLLAAPGLQNFAGGGGPDATVNGTAASAGTSQAPVAWGVFDQPTIALRVTATTAALAGAQLESAAAAAAAALNTGQVSPAIVTAAAATLAAGTQTASMLAGAIPQSLAANISQTATMTAMAQLLGSTVQSGGETAVAQLLAADLQAAFAFRSASGGGGAATRGLTNMARRPLFVIGRRATRAR